MSEHTNIKGRCDYYHIPYREDNGFTYCKKCKIFVDKIEIQFNEGWFSDWMQVNCGHCHKAIWVCSFKNRQEIEEKYKKQKRNKSKLFKKDESDYENEGVRVFVEDDQKCCICGKPTNHYDCVCSGGRIGEGISYWCSDKCRKVQEKKEKVECEILDELNLCAAEQNIDITFNEKFKIVKEILKNI